MTGDHEPGPDAAAPDSAAPDPAAFDSAVTGPSVPDPAGVATLARPVAFVLGGGGVHGAAEVGMLGALTDAEVVPDMVLGTSIGAINGAVWGQAPGPAGMAALHGLWRDVEDSGLLTDGVVNRLRRLVSTGVALHHGAQLLHLFDTALPPDITIEDLPVRFACVAACIETASAAWFDRGPLRQRLLASAAVPGLFEPVEVDGRHHYDGGLVDSIPLRRAIEFGARTVFVLQVGRVEHPLVVPSNPLQVGMVAFEISRRHGFTTLLDDLPDDVDVHVLPSGGLAPTPDDVRGNLAYRDLSSVPRVIEAARIASAAHLAEIGLPPDPVAGDGPVPVAPPRADRADDHEETAP